MRAEAQSLVAEAQLTNITRQKFKGSYDIHLAATIERAEKQIILAKQARRLLELLDDTPIVPGDAHPKFEGADAARQVLTDAEAELRAWQPSVADIPSQSGNLSEFSQFVAYVSRLNLTFALLKASNAMPAATESLVSQDSASVSDAPEKEPVAA